MSRTTRKVAQWMLSYKDNFYKRGVGHDENRCRYLKGYDHKPCSVLWEQASMAGYDHQDVASPAIRKHYKKQAARYRRRQKIDMENYNDN